MAPAGDLYGNWSLFKIYLSPFLPFLYPIKLLSVNILYLQLGHVWCWDNQLYKASYLNIWPQCLIYATSSSGSKSSCVIGHVLFKGSVILWYSVFN